VAAGAGQAVPAPLPGMIVGVKVEVGQSVKQGDVLLVLEAMKMENDIAAPVAGVVKQVLVEKGTAVSLGDPLIVIG
jgi:biotin carboxyl carrier protein